MNENNKSVNDGISDAQKAAIRDYLDELHEHHSARQSLQIREQIEKSEKERRGEARAVLGTFLTVFGLIGLGAIGFVWSSLSDSAREAGRESGRQAAEAEIRAIGEINALREAAIEDAIAAQSQAVQAKRTAEIAAGDTTIALQTANRLLSEVRAAEGTIEVLRTAERARDLIQETIQEDDILSLFEDRLAPYAIPSGAILAIPGTAAAVCPDGWQLFEPAIGRMIVGAGDSKDGIGEGLSSYIAWRNDLEELGPQTIGGDIVVLLEPSHLPDHQHAMFASGGPAGQSYPDASQSVAVTASVNAGGLANENFEYQMRPGGGEATIGLTGGTGEPKPHPNMPPYIALSWCQKT